MRKAKATTRPVGLCQNPDAMATATAMPATQVAGIALEGLRGWGGPDAAPCSKCRGDEQVLAGHVYRMISAFVACLPLAEPGLGMALPKRTGRPALRHGGGAPALLFASLETGSSNRRDWCYAGCRVQGKRGRWPPCCEARRGQCRGWAPGCCRPVQPAGEPTPSPTVRPKQAMPRWGALPGPSGRFVLRGPLCRRRLAGQAEAHVTGRQWCAGWWWPG